MHILNYTGFLNEFVDRGVDEVMDVASLELVSPKLTVIEEDDEVFGKLEQMASTAEGEEILDITGHKLLIFREPFEFIKWSQDNGIKSFIIKDSDSDKI